MCDPALAERESAEGRGVLSRALCPPGGHAPRRSSRSSRPLRSGHAHPGRGLRDSAHPGPPPPTAPLPLRKCPRTRKRVSGPGPPGGAVLGTSRAPRPRPTFLHAGAESLPTSQTRSRAAGPGRPETRDARSSAAGFESHPFRIRGHPRPTFRPSGSLHGVPPRPTLCQGPLQHCALSPSVPLGAARDSAPSHGSGNPQPASPPEAARPRRWLPSAVTASVRPLTPGVGHRPCPVTPRDLLSQAYPLPARVPLLMGQLSSWAEHLCSVPWVSSEAGRPRLNRETEGVKESEDLKSEIEEGGGCSGTGETNTGKREVTE